MEIERIFPGIYLTLDEDLWTPGKLRLNGFTHIIRIDKHISHEKLCAATEEAFILNNETSKMKLHTDQPAKSNDFTEFETLDLNFGEAAYLTTVLPNCYKGVKFIEQALNNGGSVLIIDRLNNEKCITVVVGFLMYKDHLKFR